MNLTQQQSKDLFFTAEPKFIKEYYCLAHLGGNLSTLMSYFIAIDSYTKHRLREDTDYFECCIKGFTSNVVRGIALRSLHNNVNKLKELNLIDVKSVRDKIPMTYIKINYIELTRLNREYEDYAQEFRAQCQELMDLEDDEYFADEIANPKEETIEETVVSEEPKSVEQSVIVKEECFGDDNVTNKYEFVQSLQISDSTKQMLRQWLNLSHFGIDVTKQYIRELYEASNKNENIFYEIVKYCVSNNKRFFTDNDVGKKLNELLSHSQTQETDWVNHYNKKRQDMTEEEDFIID